MKVIRRTLRTLAVMIALLAVVTPANAQDAAAGFTADFVADFEARRRPSGRAGRGRACGQVLLGTQR